jgi:hypothetical protein
MEQNVGQEKSPESDAVHAARWHLRTTSRVPKRAPRSQSEAPRVAVSGDIHGLWMATKMRK